MPYTIAPDKPGLYWRQHFTLIQNFKTLSLFSLCFAFSYARKTSDKTALCVWPELIGKQTYPTILGRKNRNDVWSWRTVSDGLHRTICTTWMNLMNLKTLFYSFDLRTLTDQRNINYWSVDTSFGLYDHFKGRVSQHFFPSLLPCWQIWMNDSSVPLVSVKWI